MIAWLFNFRCKHSSSSLKMDEWCFTQHPPIVYFHCAWLPVYNFSIKIPFNLFCPSDNFPYFFHKRGWNRRNMAKSAVFCSLRIGQSQYYQWVFCSIIVRLNNNWLFNQLIATIASSVKYQVKAMSIQRMWLTPVKRRREFVIIKSFLPG